MRRVSTVLALIAFGTTTVAAQAGPAPSDVPGKSAAAARVIGIVPGAGHVYAGEPRRGLAYLGGTVALYGVAITAIVADCLTLPAPDEDCGNGTANVALASMLGLWGWSIYDAGRAAHRTNERRRRARVSVGLAPVDHGPSGPRGLRAAVRITMAPALR